MTTTNNDNNENISYYFEENTDLNNANEDAAQNDLLFDIDKFLYNFDNMNNNDPLLNDEIFVQMKNYDINFNVKQLVLICEYYGLTKDIRLNKLKKQDIIEQIILFENNTDNIGIVIKRKEMWYYMNELKNDKLMKKFILWN